MRIFRRITIGLAVALVVLVLAGAAAVGFLRTEAGRIWVASKLSDFLSSGPDQRVAIEGIGGRLPLEVRVRRISVSDAEGQWLAVNGLDLTWSPLALLSGKIHLTRIEAAEIHLTRAPKAGPQSKKPEPDNGRLDLRPPPLSIDSFTFPFISLQTPVLGEKAAFVLLGSLAAPDQRSGSMLQVHLERTDDGPALAADLRADLVPDSSPLSVKMQLDLAESKGGLLAHVLGVTDKGPIQLHFQGNGPLSQWNGQLVGSVRELGEVTAVIGLTAAKEIGIDLAGELGMARGAGSPEFEQLTTSQNHFHLEGSFQPGRSIRLERLEIRNPNLALSSYGKLDLKSDGMDGSLNLAVEDLVSLGDAVGTPLHGKASLCGSISGTLQSPQALVALEMTNLEVRGIEARSFQTDLELKPALADRAVGASAWRLTGEGRLAGLARQGDKILPAQELSYMLEAELPPNEDPFRLNFDLAGPHLQLAVKAEASTASGDGNLHGDLQIENLEPWGALVGVELDGSLSLTSRVAGNGRNGTGTATLEGAIVSADPESPMGRVVGNRTQLAATATMDAARVLQIADLSLSGPTLHLDGSGSVDLAKSMVTTKGTFRIAKLESLASLLRQDLSGNLEGEIEANGPLDDFKGSGSVRGKNVRWRARAFQEIKAGIDASHLPHRPEGKLHVVLEHAKEKLEAATGFAVEKSKIVLTGLRLTAPGGRLESELVLSMETPAPLIQGSVLGKFEDLGRLGRFVGEPLQGSANLNARLSSIRGIQNGSLELRGKSIRTQKGNLGRLELDADLKDLYGKPQGTLRGELAAFEAGTVSLKTASIKASGDGARLAFSGEAHGHVMKSLDLEIRGSLAPSADALRVELSQARGKLGPYPFNLLSPLVIERSPRAASLNRSALAFGSGKATLSGSLSGDSVKAVVLLESIPLQVVSMFGGPELTGLAGARFDLDGATTQPKADIELRLSNVRTPTLNSQQQSRHAALEASARLERGRLQGTLELSQVLEEPARATFALPVRLVLGRDFSFAIPESEPLRAHVDFKGDLKEVALYVPLADQTFAGKAEGSLDLTGTWANPVYGGNVRISQGSYENLNSGSVFTNVNATLVARDRLLEVQHFEASDGGEGRLNLKGSLDFDLSKQFPLKLEAALINARVVRRTDLTATANGQIKATGSLKQVALSGKLAISPAEYELPSRLPPGLVDLKVINVNLPPGKAAPKKKEAQPAPPSLSLQLGLKLDFNNQVFVRGRGLDSEWKGALDIQGSADQPIVVGNLQVVRGRFDFLDRTFALTQGMISFFGSSPPAPLLDFTAESKTKDITAILKVSGTASAPQIEITSDPPLPREEVLSRVLFGRSMDKVTPVQALKLAQALQAFSGDKSLPVLDLLGGTRKLLGLDRLEFRSGEGKSETGLGLGKYLTEDVYVDVQKDLSGEGGKVSVEVELTPNLSVESEVGSDAQSGVGINWKLDY